MAHHVVMPLLEQIPLKVVFKVSFTSEFYSLNTFEYRLADRIIRGEKHDHFYVTYLKWFWLRQAFITCSLHEAVFRFAVITWNSLGICHLCIFFSLLNHSRVYKIERISTFQIAASDLKCLFFFCIFYCFFNLLTNQEASSGDKHQKQTLRTECMWKKWILLVSEYKVLHYSIINQISLQLG